MSINNREVYFTCPKCKTQHIFMDYHENTSSDNSEVFCVLNQGADSKHVWVNNPVNELKFQCDSCGEVNDWDFMFRNGFVSVENIDFYKNCLRNGLVNFARYGAFYFSDWEPELSPNMAIKRLCQMYPEDTDFIYLRKVYDMIGIRGRRYLTHYESFSNTIEKSEIPCVPCLEKVFLYDGVRCIGKEAFFGACNLQHIFLPDSVQVIDKKAFSHSGLSKIRTSNSLTEIGDCAFESCTRLENPWLPNGLIKIGERAFAGCSNIKKVFVPASVQYIGEGAFADCPKLVLCVVDNSFGKEYAVKNSIPFVVD